MKELESHNKPGKPEIDAVAPVKKQKVVDKLYPLPGHRIFELDLRTGIINEVLPEKVSVVLVPEIDIRTGRVTGGSTTQKHGGVKRKEGCLYVSALNSRSADKHFCRLLNKPYKNKKK